MKHEQKSVVMDGDTAAAYISYAFTEVASIFPITPSSTMAERVDAWAANGKKILPGDTLEIHVELLSERAEKAIVTCKCAVYTAGDLAAETGGHHRHTLRASFSPGFPGLSIFKKRPAV